MVENSHIKKWLNMIRMDIQHILIDIIFEKTEAFSIFWFILKQFGTKSVIKFFFVIPIT